MVFHLEGRNPHVFTLECAKIYTTVLNENTKKSLLFQCFSIRIYQIVKFEIFKLTFFRMTFEFLWFSGQNFSAWRKFMWIIGQNNLKSNRGWNIPNVVDLMISWFHWPFDQFRSMIFVDTCQKWVGFCENSLRSTIGLKKSKKLVLQI